jgi:sulfofructose kinase
MESYVLGVGLSTVDLIGKVKGFPEPDKLSFMSEFDIQIGGPVSNAITALSRLGVETKWIGKVGNDDFGRLILKGMEMENINIKDVAIDEKMPSPLSFIIVTESGERSIIFYPGCSNAMGREIPREIIQNASIIHLDGTFVDAAFQVASMARELGVKVSLDAGFTFPALEDLLKMTDIFIPNYDMAKDLAKEEDVNVCLKKIWDMGPSLVVITKGGEGSWGYEGGQILKQDAIKVKAVDTTGCGDAFHGGFLYGELRGWELQRKLLFASAYASVKATSLGGRKGLPTMKGMELFIKERNLEF